MNRKPEQTLFRMMLLRTLGPSLILILAFLAFFCILLGMMASHNTNTFHKHQEERLKQSVTDVEKNLKQVEYAQREIINSQAFFKFSYMYEDLNWYDRYALQIQLQEALCSMRIAYDYVQSAWLSIPSIGKVISDTRVNTTLPKQLDFLEGTEKNRFLKDHNTLMNVQVRSDGDADLAMIVVILNEDGIKDDLAYACTSDKDWVEVFWGLTDEGTKATGTPSVHKKVGSMIAAIKGESFPLQAFCFSSANWKDGFVQQVILLCVMFVMLVLLGVTLSLVLWYRQIYIPLHRLLIDAFDRAV